MNVRVPARSRNPWRSGSQITCLSCCIFTDIQGFTSHYARARPSAGKILEFDARFDIKVTRDWLVHDEDFIVTCPLPTACAEDVKAVRAVRNHFSGDGRSARFSPGIAGILKIDGRGGNRVGWRRPVLHVLNRNRSGRVGRQPCHREHHAFVVKSAAIRGRVLGNVDGVGRRQSSHQTRAGHGNSSGESVIARRCGGGLVHWRRKQNRHLGVRAVAHRADGSHSQLRLERHTAEARDQEQ